MIMERDRASNALYVGSNHTLHSIILNFPLNIRVN
jgi:hypothetical protein